MPATRSRLRAEEGKLKSPPRRRRWWRFRERNASMFADSNVVKVTIFGAEYAIRGDSDPEYIRHVAEYVDSKMREVDESTSVNSSLKVAILAALNIADELFRERAEKEEILSSYNRKLRILASKLDEYLHKEATE
jgi:cell division protein ZapA